MRTTRLLLFPAFLAAASVIAPVAAHAATYGLNVGINDYLGRSNDLSGAVNDAEDIAASLIAAGAAEVVLLTDAAATKAAIESEWFRLVDAAAPGDTIVFSYAGHGGQEPEPAGRHGERDGMNETFVLAGYQSFGEGAVERIVDDEIFEWLKYADDRDVSVIFVADSCHSGTMYRTVNDPALRYRIGDFAPPETEAELPDQAFAEFEETDFRNVTFIGATQEDRLTPELMIDGVPRGALSWAFARAIEGAADSDGDNRLTQYELLDYLVPAVEIHAQNQQVPSLLPFAPEPKQLIAIGDAVENVAPPPAQTTYVTVYAAGDGSVALPEVAGVFPADSPAQADIVWDSATGAVDHRVAGRIAENIGPNDIRGVLEKWTVLALIRPVAARDPFALELIEGNGVHHPGDVLTIDAGGADRPYLTLFNLPPNGRVELLLPSSADDLTMDWIGNDATFRLQVDEPPYGGEHLVAILTNEPALGLQAALETMSQTGDSTGLGNLIAAFIATTEFQAGILGIYTAAN